MSDMHPFDRVERDIVETIFLHNPIVATMYGRHERDARMPDNSAGAIAAQVADYAALLDRLRAIPAETMEPARRIDRALLLATLESSVFRTRELREHETNPSRAAEWAIYAVYFLMLRGHLPLEPRVRAMAARLQAIPAWLDTARAQLRDVPPLFAKVGAQVAGGGAAFVEEVLGYVRDRDATLLPVLEGPAAAAAAAFTAYAAALTDEIAPTAQGNWCIGREKLDWLFRHEHLLPEDAAGIAARGRAVFAELRQQLEDTARQIDPAATWIDLIERAKQDVPEAGEVLARYVEETAACVRFVREKHIAPIPDGEICKIVETPVFDRPVIPYAAYQQPGPFETVQEGHFYVTPVDAQASADDQRDQLQGHCRASRILTAVHEAYPGHHLQLMHANRCGSLARLMGDSSVLAEGWALYCEQMMWEEGFYSDPLLRLWQLKDALWRAGRIIVDVGLHTGEMTFDEAVAFMVDEVRLEPANARSEVTRYCMTPTQPSSYMLGKLALLDLRDEVKAREGAAFSLHDFHARVLSAGTIPVPLVRAHVLELEPAIPA